MNLGLPTHPESPDPCYHTLMTKGFPICDPCRRLHDLPKGERQLKTVCRACNKIVICHLVEPVPQAPPKEHILSVSAAAEYLGVSISSLHKWDAKGILCPQRTAGGHRRYKLSDLKAFALNR